jgi:hypothetical protein
MRYQQFGDHVSIKVGIKRPDFGHTQGFGLLLDVGDGFVGQDRNAGIDVSMSILLGHALEERCEALRGGLWGGHVNDAPV